MATYSKGSVYTGTVLTNAAGGTTIPASSQITVYQVPSGPSVTKMSGWIYLANIQILFGPTTVWNASTTQGWGISPATGFSEIWNGNPYPPTVTLNQPLKLCDGVTYTVYSSGLAILHFNDYTLRGSDYIILKNQYISPQNSWAFCLTLTTISQS